MRITTVRFRRLQSHDRGYGHDAVEAEAQVGEDETAEEAIAALKAWVAGELAHLKKVAELSETAERLMHRVKRYEDDLESSKREIANNREILTKHVKLVEFARANGLGEAVDGIDDGLPF